LADEGGDQPAPACPGGGRDQPEFVVEVGEQPGGSVVHGVPGVGAGGLPWTIAVLPASATPSRPAPPLRGVRPPEAPGSFQAVLSCTIQPSRPFQVLGSRQHRSVQYSEERRAGGWWPSPVLFLSSRARVMADFVIRVGSSSVQGARPNNEDALVVDRE